MFMKKMIMKCFILNENISSICNINGIALPSAVPENNPDRFVWIEEIIKNLNVLKHMIS